MNEASGDTGSQKTKVLTGGVALVAVIILGWFFIDRDGGGEPEAPAPVAAQTKAEETAPAPEPAAAIAAVEPAVEAAAAEAGQAIGEAATPVAEAAAEVAAAVGQVTETAVEPAEAAAQEVVAGVSEQAEAVAEIVADLAPTKFDLFRAEQDGSMVVAGQATPNALVELLVDGQKVGEARASSSGEYTALLDAGAAIVDRMLTLRVTGEDGVAREGSESIVVAASDIQAPVVVADAEGARVLEGASEQLVIDTLAEGALTDGGVISGRGAPEGALVRAYLDNAEVGLAAAAPDGSWRIELPKIGAGAHVLRVDALDAAGKVIARAETQVTGAAEELAQTAPARQPAPEGQAGVSGAASGAITAVAVPADQQDQPPPAGVRRITIERGNTLWAIARETYGDGFLYVRVFEANRSQIRDPDLIYPGQVFDLPE
ncbi:LysM peptidoglycan-binding domain-containing protein [Thioclava sp. A2]|uniref:LysM peptidoglycan-binding domain-containing protein n=1 Tax=Thioclava sp. FCG-A2 TaxID=3080562 RepID=UPI0029534F3D|nr:LysM peptidoglycan-binding domain-containing protein [Thioclava sp. A2]MDV7269465.1 LysM peptidoglycan-binding domain-containing protein [Thioclava sp. A2]